jgi:hypothetical protein
MQSIGMSAVTAYTAHQEWATRPPDERYASVSALYDAARARRVRTEKRAIETGEFRTEAEGNGMLIQLKHINFKPVIVNVEGEKKKWPVVEVQRAGRRRQLKLGCRAGSPIPLGQRLCVCHRSALSVG